MINKKIIKIKGMPITERRMEVNGTYLHIRSIFTDQTKLDDALQKIITRRLSEANNSIQKATLKFLLENHQP